MTHLDDTCLICSTGLQNIRNELRGSRRDDSGKPLADIVILESWCTSCEIFLTRMVIGRESDTGWKTSFVQEDTLTKSLTPDELAKTLQDNEIDSLLKKKLEKFLSMKKEQDEFYEYVLRDEPYTIKGFTIRREKNLIGEFRYFVERDPAQNRCEC